MVKVVYFTSFLYRNHGDALSIPEVLPAKGRCGILSSISVATQGISDLLSVRGHSGPYAVFLCAEVHPSGFADAVGHTGRLLSAHYLVDHQMVA